MKKIYRTICMINRYSVLLAGWAVFLMMLIIVIDIGASQLFSTPLSGTIEATQSLMVVAVFLSLSYNQNQSENIEMTLFFNKLKPMTQRRVSLVSHLAQSSFIFLIVLASWQLALHSLTVLEYQSGYFSFPVYPAKLVMALGMSFLFLQNLFELYKNAYYLFKKGKNSCTPNQ